MPIMAQNSGWRIATSASLLRSHNSLLRTSLVVLSSASQLVTNAWPFFLDGGWISFWACSLLHYFSTLFLHLTAGENFTSYSSLLLVTDLSLRDSGFDACLAFWTRDFFERYLRPLCPLSRPCRLFWPCLLAVQADWTFGCPEQKGLLVSCFLISFSQALSSINLRCIPMNIRAASVQSVVTSCETTAKSTCLLFRVAFIAVTVYLEPQYWPCGPGTGSVFCSAEMDFKIASAHPKPQGHGFCPCATGLSFWSPCTCWLSMLLWLCWLLCCLSRLLHFCFCMQYLEHNPCLENWHWFSCAGFLLQGVL